MKKLIVFIFSLILSVVFSTSASAVKIDGIYYNIFSDETAVVTYGEEKYSGDVVIPTSITVEGKEYTVTSIGKDAFNACRSLTSVIIPNSVTSIGESAFYFCLSLTSVTIPNSVTSISYAAFSTCGLKDVTIPNSVTSIGDCAFYGCSSLEKIIIVNNMFVHLPESYSGHYSISNNISQIIGGAFNRCSGLTSVTIPNSVTSIGERAFNDCIGLKNVTIPNSVTIIGSSAFCNCRGLTSVTIPNSVTSIGSGAFSYCAGLTSVTIPNSVTSIGVQAFEYCSNLKSVTIPNSVTSIGKRAFYECKGLTSVTIPNSVTNIGDNAFYRCPIEELYYDCSINPGINYYNFQKLTVGDNISVVYDYFSSSSLKKITLGKNVTQIREKAFESSQIEDFTITGEEPPYLYPNVFGTQDLSKATLNVPESKIEYYQTTEPWSLFGKVLTLSGETPKDPEKCSTPSILFSEGKLQFTCNTEGAKFYYTLNSTDVKRSETLVEANTVALSACYEISCTAKAEGFANSDVATAKLYWLPTADIGTNINTAKTRGIVIQSAGGFITLSGLETNERVDFYAIDGAALGSATATDGTATFSAKSGTIVVAKIGKESVKIAVE